MFYRAKFSVKNRGYDPEKLKKYSNNKGMHFYFILITVSKEVKTWTKGSKKRGRGGGGAGEEGRGGGRRGEGEGERGKG